MPRRRVPISGRFPYHVTARANNKDFFYAPLPLCWAILTDRLSKTIEKYGVEILSFVMMSNHFHLILRTPMENLSQAMHFFMRETSRGIGTASDRMNHLWGGPYNASLIETSSHFAQVYKYVYRNPVDAALGPRVEAYRYSTLRWVLGNSMPFPVLDSVARDFGDMSRDMNKRLAWLNSPYDPRERELIRRGLKHGQFKISEGDHNFQSFLKSTAYLLRDQV
jgi:putative transposase